MRLTWSDPSGIASALLKAYPEADRLHLEPAALRDMIESLPGFGRPEGAPSPDRLRHILWTWMRLADGG
jgi:FeS assembly protein IscX